MLVTWHFLFLASFSFISASLFGPRAAHVSHFNHTLGKGERSSELVPTGKKVLVCISVCVRVNCLVSSISVNECYQWSHLHIDPCSTRPIFLDDNERLTAVRLPGFSPRERPFFRLLRRGLRHRRAREQLGALDLQTPGQHVPV